MKRLLCLLLLLAAPALRAADALSEPGPAVVAGVNDAAWRPLFAALAAKGAVFSKFTEHRWFPFRKIPVVLTGEMRFSPLRGLSLRYLTPEERLVVMDDRGLLLRDTRGRSREIPADPHAPLAATVLLPVMRFDLDAVLKIFEVRAARAGTDWRLDFVPRDPQLAGAIGRIEVTGEGETVRQLEFRRSALQRVDILIGETRTGMRFTPDEERRFFR